MVTSKMGGFSAVFEKSQYAIFNCTEVVSRNRGHKFGASCTAFRSLVSLVCTGLAARAQGDDVDSNPMRGFTGWLVGRCTRRRAYISRGATRDTAHDDTIVPDPYTALQRDAQPKALARVKEDRLGHLLAAARLGQQRLGLCTRAAAGMMLLTCVPCAEERIANGRREGGGVLISVNWIEAI